MKERGHKIILTERAVDEIINLGYDTKMGARPLARAINDHIKVPVSKMLLFDNVLPKSTIHVDFVDGDFMFEEQGTQKALGAPPKALTHDAESES